MTDSKRPKDMTNEELMAMPETPMCEYHNIVFEPKDIRRGFITYAGQDIPLYENATVGDSLNIPHVIKLVPQGLEWDDIMMFSDHNGDVWIPILREDGQWGKRRFL